MRISLAWLLLLVCSLSVTSSHTLAQVNELEPNNTPLDAQNLDGQFGLNFDSDIGDQTTNTSTSISHVTVIGDGSGPESGDFYKFTVSEPGRAIIEIDYGTKPFNEETRVGMARQTDGTFWLLYENVLYFLDANDELQFGMDVVFPLELQNALAVHPSTGVFYAVTNDDSRLVSIDPATAVATPLGISGLGELTSLAFNAAGRLFAIANNDFQTSDLIEIDPTTGGVISQIGEMNVPDAGGMAFHPISDQMVAIAEGNSYQDLSSMAIDSGGDIYLVSNRQNNQIVRASIVLANQTTGQHELIGTLEGLWIQAIAFDSADRLYATATNAGSHGISMLYELDPTDASIISSIGNTGLKGVKGLDFQPGTNTLFAQNSYSTANSFASPTTSDGLGDIFAVRNEGFGTTLYSIDTLSEIATPISSMPLPKVTAMAMDSGGNLFVLEETNNLEYQLREVDPVDGSVVSTRGAISGQEIRAMAFDPVSGDLFAHSNRLTGEFDSASLASNLAGDLFTVNQGGDLYQLDSATLTTTLLGNTGLGDSITSIAFDATDRLFAVTGARGSQSDLYELDPSDGSIIAGLGNTGVLSIKAMDFHPSTGTLFAHASGQRSDRLVAMTSHSNGDIYAITNESSLVRLDPAEGVIYTIREGFNLANIGLAFDKDDRLYFLTADDENEYILLELDPANGLIIDLIGELGVDFASAIAFHPTTNVLYAHGNSPGELMTIDTTTGLASSVGLSGLGSTASDLAFDPDTNVLFGFSQGPASLHSFDLGSGAATSVGPLGTQLGAGGLAVVSGTFYFSRFEAELYTVNTTTGAGSFFSWINEPAQLVTLDKTTGVATHVADTFADGNISDFSFDPADDQLFGLVGFAKDLVTVDISNGDINFVGNANYMNNANGIAFDRMNGDLFVKVSSQLHSVDKATGASNGSSLLVQREAELISIDTSNAAVTLIGLSMFDVSGEEGIITDFAFDTDIGSGTFGTLFGINAGNGDVYTFNTGSGAATLLGDSGCACSNTGLVHDGTTLWIKNNASFRTVNTGTGVSLAAFNASGGSALDSQLFTLDINTAAATSIGANGSVNFFTDMAFSANGSLFAVDGGSRLYDINTASGVSTELGSITPDESYVVLGWDDSATSLFSLDSQDLVSIDHGTLIATLERRFENPPGRLADVDINTAQLSNFRPAWDDQGNFGDLAFSADGVRLMGFEYGDTSSLVEFDPVAGTGTALWGMLTNDTGIAFHPDGGLRLKNDDDGVYLLDTVDASVEFEFVTADRNQNTPFAIDSSGTYFTVDVDDESLLYTIDPVSGELSLVGNIGLEIGSIAFDDTDQLFGVVESSGVLYEIDPGNGNILATIGNTGSAGIESLSYDPISGMLFANDNDTGELLVIDPSDATTAPVGATGSKAIRSLAFANDGTLYGWNGNQDSDEDFIGSPVSALIEIDPLTGASSVIGRHGNFGAGLNLFANDRETILAGSVSSAPSAGALGSSSGRDPYIEYAFTQPGVYYIRVSKEGDLPTPLGGTYVLQCSLEGGELPIELLLLDGFE